MTPASEYSSVMYGFRSVTIDDLGFKRRSKSSVFVQHRRLQFVLTADGVIPSFTAKLSESAQACAQSLSHLAIATRWKPSHFMTNRPMLIAVKVGA